MALTVSYPHYMKVNSNMKKKMTRLQRAILEADDEEALTDDTPFAGLDLRGARCFSYSVPEQKNWKFLADQADDVGWKLIDSKQLERNLAKDVEASYMKIAQFKLVNVDDDTSYTLWFDNNKKLWNVSISDSPKADLDVEERANFFKSDMFKKVAKKVYYRLISAKESYDNIIRHHLEHGELLLVDTVKLNAIIHFLESEHFLDNLLNGKYLSY